MERLRLRAVSRERTIEALRDAAWCDAQFPDSDFSRGRASALRLALLYLDGWRDEDLTAEMFGAAGAAAFFGGLLAWLAPVEKGGA